MYLLKVMLLAMFFMTVARAALYAYVPYRIPDAITLPERMRCFIYGLWFDSVASCYVVALPLLVLVIMACTGWQNRRCLAAVRLWLEVFFGIAVTVSVANVPYFRFFFQNINAGIFQWFAYKDTTAGMILGETEYAIATVAAILTTAIFVWMVHRIALPLHAESEKTTPARQGMPAFAGRLAVGIAGMALMALCAFGIRGRMGYNPIKTSQAYYCTDPFLNQVGINPLFNLLTSYLDTRRPENALLHLTDDEAAVSYVCQYLHTEGVPSVSPIALRVEADSGITGRNVVVILMESMSTALMGNEKGQSLTPFLDSLSRDSWCFSNMYSAGNHTNHGIYATLYSWPAIMFRNQMKGSVVPKYSGLPTVLREKGYSTMFFMTHESQYDNMNAFLRTNGFDEIYSQEDYPREKVVNSFGVQDDFLYQYAIPRIGEAARRGTGFLAVMLSVSNHPPYVIPDSFKPRSRDMDAAIVEYADWSIRRFFEEARRQPWYDNTIFVLLGDHGKVVGTPECELPESFNHIPLIIHGKGITPRVTSTFALQEDVAPTLLGMLGVAYTRNNFGIDLRQRSRQCAFYTGDRYIAARDSARLFLYNPKEDMTLLYRTDGGTLRQAGKADAAFQALKTHAFSMLQCAETLIQRKQTTDNVKE